MWKSWTLKEQITDTTEEYINRNPGIITDSSNQKSSPFDQFDADNPNTEGFTPPYSGSDSDCLLQTLR
jgi:hypothetical protein